MTSENSGLEAGQIYTTSKELPIKRFIGINFFPFIEYAERAMNESTDGRTRGDVIWLEDYFKLEADPLGHLPYMNLS